MRKAQSGILIFTFDYGGVIPKNALYILKTVRLYTLPQNPPHSSNVRGKTRKLFNAALKEGLSTIGKEDGISITDERLMIF